MEAPILLGSDETFSGPCLPGVLSLSSFLSVTIWVTSLGSVCEVASLAELLFYPNIYGVPKWFITLPPLCRKPQGRIAQVQIFLPLVFISQGFQRLRRYITRCVLRFRKLQEGQLGLTGTIDTVRLPPESGVKTTSSGLERLQPVDLAEYVVDQVA